MATAVMGPATKAHAFSSIYPGDDEALTKTKKVQQFEFDASNADALNEEMLLAVKAKLAEVESAQGEDSNSEVSIIKTQIDDALLLAKDYAKDIGKPKYVASTVSVKYSKSNVGGGSIHNLSAYSSSPDECSGNPFITASGKRVHWGTVAAPRGIPFGTRLMIPDLFGDKVFIVEDRGGAIRGNKLDIWFPSKASALQFGRKNARVVWL